MTHLKITLTEFVSSTFRDEMVRTEHNTSKHTNTTVRIEFKSLDCFENHVFSLRALYVVMTAAESLVFRISTSRSSPPASKKTSAFQIQSIISEKYEFGVN